MSGTEATLLDDCEDRSSHPDSYDDHIAHQLLEEPWWATKRRKSAEKVDAWYRIKLADENIRRAVYRDIADSYYGSDKRLTDAEFRLLSYLLRRADADLGNCFPSQRTAARKLRKPRSTINKHVMALRKKGWIKTHQYFFRNGRQSSSNVQFQIPEGVLPLGGSWTVPYKKYRRQKDDPMMGEQVSASGQHPKSEGGHHHLSTDGQPDPQPELPSHAVDHPVSL